jgi:hypothetical protein
MSLDRSAYYTNQSGWVFGIPPAWISQREFDRIGSKTIATRTATAVSVYSKSQIVTL